VAELDDDDFTFESAADNPAVAAAAEALTQQDEAPELRNPLDGPVTLPAGYRRIRTTDSGTSVDEVRKAWVRELNGEDEEKIARAKLKDDLGAFITAILECGIEKLGDERPTRDDLASLVVGDQQYLLMEIARVTYGDEITYTRFACPFCREEFDVSFSLEKDIPVIRLDKVEEVDFEVRLKNDRIASVTLPTAEVQALLNKAETGADANTILIAQCVSEIRGPNGTKQIQGDLGAARSLGLKDRQDLVVAMGERMPGPQYNEVRFTHEPDGCGQEVRLQVTLADLFRGL
jgi:hypothetical protein